MQVKLEQVLDLTESGIANALPEMMPVLLAEDWRAIMSRGEEATSQAIGRAVYAAGLQGILVPSIADPEGVNLLAFPESLARDSVLAVLNSEELDRLGRNR